MNTVLLQNKSQSNFYSKDYKILTRKETLKLFQKKEALEKRNKREAAEIRNYLWEMNRRLVFKTASRFAIICPRNLLGSLDYEDLVQEGLLGLEEAINRYKWKKGFAFSTYATWWIRHYILRGIGNSSQTIRIPLSLREKIMKLNKKKEEIIHSEGYIPTDQEVGRMMGMSHKEVHTIKKGKDGVSSALIRSFDIGFYNPSLEQDLKLRDREGLLDVIPEQEQSVTAQIEEKELREEIRKMFNTYLTKKEKIIIMARCGFFEGRIYTLQEIGNYFGLTRERIRQIQEEILKKLYKVCCKRNLELYFDLF